MLGRPVFRPGGLTRYSRLASSPWPATTALRPRTPISPILSRTAASEAGEDDSGHIKTERNEGIFFLDNVFPLKFQWLSRIPLLNWEQQAINAMSRIDQPNAAFASPLSIVHRAFPETLPVKITEVLPRIREGGAFVKFSHDANIDVFELEGTLRKYMQEKPIRPWFNPLRRVRAFLVRGQPWIEDLYRLPSSRIRVEFLPTSPEASAAELTQEQIFTLFRKYGKLFNIEPQPSDSKVLPKYALVDFERARFATMAKACLHGFVLPESEGGGKTGTVLNLKYESQRKSYWWWDWMTNHPRIVLPLLVALFSATAVAVFDPIRIFSIKTHITHAFGLGDYKDYTVVKFLKKWIMRGYDAITLRKRRAEDDSFRILWEDRQETVEQLKTWLIETADTFIVVQGPRGAGKKELVLDYVLNDNHQQKIVVDCKKIQEARGDSATITAAAAEVGYRPIFSWMNSISSMIDLAAMGTIGTKTGFSETLDQQLSKIWNNTATALKEVALSHRKSDDKDANLGDDDWLEAHPECRPVVVVDNFLHKSNETGADMVYDKISEWAARLTTSNIAHVIFLTTDVSFSKSLSKALPDRVFRTVTLGDCTPEVAKKMVLRHLDADGDDHDKKDDSEEKKPRPSESRADLDELDSVIQVLGGRLTDLEFLARRIKAGESPGSAVQQITEQSASEILKMYLLDADKNWSPQQAWILIRDLANNEKIRYNEVLLNDAFSSKGEEVLQALEQAELITITSQNGRPNAIKPGKPIYQAAFEYLREDDVLRARFELAVLTDLAAKEAKTIDKCEAELRILAELPNASDLKPRVFYLLQKVLASQQAIEKYEAKSGGYKKILKEKY
ncbi:Mitochondrial escape protein 2 [Cyphellophora attinorum]|uniref:Mitochondrial escape protein 2 n=1 Tax=Cyphellophora attinorum TaxID=1664694 RepID=A0A0N1GYB9_9EURO|nr:Mitochondrial escape protein 2 [Phialophora attinorum]KPI35693.1 Mitochondrial escape protein 2 [Phialophora attinorum]